MGLPGRENTWGKCRHMRKRKRRREEDKGDTWSLESGSHQPDIETARK